jgi:hypothetical protein
MWKSFVLELYDEWSEFTAGYDRSAPRPLCRQQMQRCALGLALTIVTTLICVWGRC